MDIYQGLAECEGFDWDKGNILKSWEKHKVSAVECEQIFFNIPLIAAHDVQHAQEEPRYFALGRTDAGRHLFTAFTIRKNLIRVISARDMNRKERRLYETS
ncbi:MAG: BrnT family toxin [Nitrospirae bacterium]|nr:MAG: BrnT family toxin [Nitrospirota bacterium]